MIKPLIKAGLSLVILLFVGHVFAQQDPDMPMVTGEHWTKATLQGKRAYLVGVINIIEIEQGLHARMANPPANNESVVPVMIEGLKDMTLDEIRVSLDQWYADNGDQLKRPVLETIWFEMALPNAQ